VDGGPAEIPYVKLLNERKNEILSLEIDNGPRSEAGFFSHDPDKDFDHAEIALRKATRRLSKIQAKYAQSRARAIRNALRAYPRTGRRPADAGSPVMSSR
jgi:hypothetical protein